MEKPEIDPPPRDLAGESSPSQRQASSSASPQKPDKVLAADKRGEDRPSRRRIVPTPVQRIRKRSTTPEDKDHKDSLTDLSSTASLPADSPTTTPTDNSKADKKIPTPALKASTKFVPEQIAKINAAARLQHPSPADVKSAPTHLPQLAQTIILSSKTFDEALTRLEEKFRKLDSNKDIDPQSAIEPQTNTVASEPNSPTSTPPKADLTSILGNGKDLDMQNTIVPKGRPSSSWNVDKLRKYIRQTTHTDTRPQRVQGQPTIRKDKYVVSAQMIYDRIAHQTLTDSYSDSQSNTSQASKVSYSNASPFFFFRARCSYPYPSTIMPICSVRSSFCS